MEENAKDRAASPLVPNFVITDGRTNSKRDLELATMVKSVASSLAWELGPGHRKVHDLAKDDFISIAELSAYSKIPLSSVKTILDDLLRDGHVRVQTASSPLPRRQILEEVLDGLTRL